MANYYVDLGFDWYAKADGNNNRYLQWGIVNTTTDDHVLGTLNDLRGGDKIYFNIYDVTQLTHGSGSPANTAPSLGDAWMTWTVSEASEGSATPFSSTPAVSDAVVGTAGSWNSVFFGGTFPAWPVMTQDTGGAFGVTVNAPAETTPATFQLTWQLTVTSNGTSQNYRVDPEMIVKPGG